MRSAADWERSQYFKEAFMAIQAPVHGRPLAHFPEIAASVKRRASSAALAIIGGSALLFMCLPIAIVVPMSFSSAPSLQFPPPGLSLRWYYAFFSDPRWIEALQISLLVAFVSSLLALILGSLAAYGLTRGNFFGRRGFELNFAVPMVIPHIVSAVALYIAFARAGLLGSLAGLILAHTVLAVPYVVLVVSVALNSLDRHIEQMAFSLGASWPTVLLRVIAPNLAPSLIAAWIFAFIVSFDEITVTVFLAGTYDTIPKRMFTQLLERIDPTISAVATLLIAGSTLTVAAVALLMHRAGLLVRFAQ
jgi:putative spermidine/putrescine transport system permease protein